MRAFAHKPLLLAFGLALLVLIPRAALQTSAHSESFDDEYHLLRGMRFWARALSGTYTNDPPLGAGLRALPLVALADPPYQDELPSPLYGQRRSPEQLRMALGIWGALLATPLALLAFAWARRLYGSRAGWLALALLLADPNFAAHIPLGAIDVLGALAAAAGVFFWWRTFEHPSPRRIVGATFSTAAALLTKHTAIILPAVAFALALYFWLVVPRLAGHDKEAQPRPRWRRLVWAAALFPLALWALTLFDVSRPVLPYQWSPKQRAEATLWQRPWPAGIYIGSVLQGKAHSEEGHPAYLFGQKRRHGWASYFPLLLSIKLPLGTALVALLALLSLCWRRPSPAEVSLLLPALAWATFLIASGINIGIRHFLPAYFFLLLLAARAGAVPDQERALATSWWSRALRWRALPFWAALATALHGASFHPDYIAYANLPRQKLYLAISDSNIDWGQALPQVRRFVDARAPRDRPIAFKYFGDSAMARRVRHYLGERVRLIRPQDPPPNAGLLIVSAVWVAGPYDSLDTLAPLRQLTPIAVIGHGSNLVYDLDATPIRWPNGGRMKTPLPAR